MGPPDPFMMAAVSMNAANIRQHLQQQHQMQQFQQQQVHQQQQQQMYHSMPWAQAPQHHNQLVPPFQAHQQRFHQPALTPDLPPSMSPPPPPPPPPPPVDIQNNQPQANTSIVDTSRVDGTRDNGTAGEKVKNPDTDLEQLASKGNNTSNSRLAKNSPFSHGSLNSNHASCSAGDGRETGHGLRKANDSAGRSCGTWVQQQQQGSSVRPRDWICQTCQANNFSHRAECFKCRSNKSMSAPDISISDSPSLTQGSGRPQHQVDWPCNICGNKKNFANRTSCFRCNAPRDWSDNIDRGSGAHRQVPVPIVRPVPSSSSSSVSTFAHEDRATQIEHDRLLEQENQFDSMFEKWEANFEQWKIDNDSNPDWDYVQNHIDDMNRLREKMLQRRESLNQKRQQLLGKLSRIDCLAPYLNAPKLIIAVKQRNCNMHITLSAGSSLGFVNVNFS
jgi:hypothetical protein